MTDSIKKDEKEELKEIIQLFLKYDQAAWTSDVVKAARMLRDTVQGKKGIFTKPKVKQLAVSKLKRREVENLLNLEWTGADPELKAIHPVPMSAELCNVLRKVDNAACHSEASEALIRLTLNMLLVYAHDTVTSQISTTARPLSLQAERTWVYDVEKDLVWRRGATPSNVIAVEAKTKGRASEGIYQCLAYMGIVRNERKKRSHQTCAVYGFASDDEEFCFLKINDNSQWSECHLQVRTGDYSQVLGMLVHIFRQAAIASPLQSKEPSQYTHSRESTQHGRSKDSSRQSEPTIRESLEEDTFMGGI
ncbi:uncharacterized protein N7458_007120 [Penicillium daleae]|uniref:Uncharacterized protein n=1 Tax=Penicillium daleae TaxID=63821 RepID=A0AAD6G3M5_9EURO|nr:uncharacterized protein N7458_007120 [Penicillium daleae]KAJ5450671.1 hypothetical protein N7458_007120 [Penicillium daleae]